MAGARAQRTNSEGDCRRDNRVGARKRKALRAPARRGAHSSCAGDDCNLTIGSAARTNVGIWCDLLSTEPAGARENAQQADDAVGAEGRTTLSRTLVDGKAETTAR